MAPERFSANSIAATVIRLIAYFQRIGHGSQIAHFQPVVRRFSKYFRKSWGMLLSPGLLSDNVHCLAAPIPNRLIE